MPNVWATVGSVVGYIPVTALTGTADQLFGMNAAGTIAEWKNAKFNTATGQLRVPIGSAAAPSYTFEGNLGYGTYLDGISGGLAWSVSGTRRGYINTTELATSVHIRAIGKLFKEDQGANIACAATTDLGTATGNFLTLTNNAGATNISSLGGDTVEAGTEIEAVMSITGGSVTFVHNATDLICLGGANVACQDKDIFRFRKINDAAAKWQMVGLARGIATGILTAAGDLLVGLGSNSSGRLGVGTDGMMLVANAGAAEKMTWLSNAIGFNLVNGYLEWTVAGSALTIAVKGWNGADPSDSNPVFCTFRDPTVANPGPIIRKINAALSLSISNGSTLGTRNSVPFRIWAGLVDDGGTIRLAAINCVTTVAGVGTGSDVTGITSLNGWQIISSTAEGGAGAADNAQTFYTGVAVANKAFAPVGYATWEGGLAAAGTWSAGPTRKQLWQVGSPLAGQPTGQLARLNTGAVATGTTTIPADDTIPQNTEGDQYMSQAITPLSAADILSVETQVHVANSAAPQALTVALFRDTTANAIVNSNSYADSVTGSPRIIRAATLLLAESTAAITFKTRIGAGGASTSTFNGSAGARLYGGVFNSYLSITGVMG